ncbi:hypothetical protein [Sphaerisporangium aureirubrum]|uniref:Uncharacterized protein n=1 Tax=Sphaerisporangium aureirubrum TaxID=1544736 RepID=A0ABW1NBH9_9ACTN
MISMTYRRWALRGSAVLGTAVVVLSTVGVPGASAQVLYPSCGGEATKTSTSTTAYIGGCFKAQARIDRYYAGLPRSYYGPETSTTSSVTASDGSLIGNAARFYVANSGDPGKHWTSYIYF